MPKTQGRSGTGRSQHHILWDYCICLLCKMRFFKVNTNFWLCLSFCLTTCVVILKCKCKFTSVQYTHTANMLVSQVTFWLLLKGKEQRQPITLRMALLFSWIINPWQDVHVMCLLSLNLRKLPVIHSILPFAAAHFWASTSTYPTWIWQKKLRSRIQWAGRLSHGGSLQFCCPLPFSCEVVKII